MTLTSLMSPEGSRDHSRGLVCDSNTLATPMSPEGSMDHSRGLVHDTKTYTRKLRKRKSKG